MQTNACTIVATVTAERKNPVKKSGNALNGNRNDNDVNVNQNNARNHNDNKGWRGCAKGLLALYRFEPSAQHSSYFFHLRLYLKYFCFTYQFQLKE